MTAENRQWIRSCSLVLADRTGIGTEMGDLRVTFSITRGETETPNTAEIRVYNLSEATASGARKEFTRVLLSGGYRENTGVLFDGNIVQIRQGKENGTDTWLEIHAADGDRACNFAAVNTTLSAGTGAADQVRVCGKAFSDKGTQTGFIPEISGRFRMRGKALFGMARKYLRDAAEDTGCTWSVQEGKLQMVKKDGYLPGEALVLTPDTGLIGTPEETQDGMAIRCLINPRLRVNGRVKLERGAGTDKAGNGGFYRILKMSLTGDTRGNDWYMDLTCIGLSGASGKPLNMTG